MDPEAFVARYEEALASQQWETVAPLIHPRCTVTFSNGLCHQGIKAVEEAFRRNFELISNETYSIADLHWVMKGETFAVYTFTYRWSGLIGGEPASGEGRGTSTVVSQDEKWQLLSEHLGPRS